MRASCLSWGRRFPCICQDYGINVPHRQIQPATHASAGTGRLGRVRILLTQQPECHPVHCRQHHRRTFRRAMHRANAARKTQIVERPLVQLEGANRRASARQAIDPIVVRISREQIRHHDPIRVARYGMLKPALNARPETMCHDYRIHSVESGGHSYSQ